MEFEIAAIKKGLLQKRYQCLNLLKKEKLKGHFCFQKRNGGDMDTEEIALLFFRSLYNRSDDCIFKRREGQQPFGPRVI